MFRFLTLSNRRLFSTQYSTGSKTQYLLFPTSTPIPPYYFYCTRINRHLYQYILKHKIKYVAAFPIRPAVYRQSFYPVSQDHLEAELGLVNYAWQQKNSRSQQNMAITHNNVIYDGPLGNPQQSPVKFVSYLDQIYPVGSVCSINLNHTPQENIYTMFLRAEIRLQAENGWPSNPLTVISGKTLKTQTVVHVNKQYEQLTELYQKIKSISTVNLPDIDTKSQKAITKVVQLMSGYLCTVSYFSQDKLYTIFKSTSIVQKINILVRCYKQYLSVLEQKWKGLSSNHGTVQSRQKQALYSVYDQMKKIVGNPSQTKFIQKIKLKLKERTYPEQVRKLIQAQLLSLQSQHTHDASRKKHYINLLSDYPFGIVAKQQFDLKKAKNILDQDHYGMVKLKKRILEFIAVSKLKGQFKSKVLLLYGPPGVGKTSVVKSIAKCLGRPYARISLGGEYDTSIVKGHRKTYVGAYPGKIWDSIARSKVQNPVILLDQIDKIINRAGGASLQDAVMQVLDPIQNHKFKDDFMDVQIDLSKVLFVCTANTLDTIFPPLLDRLQRIEVAGYTTIQKQQIFKRYILTEALKNNGLLSDPSNKKQKQQVQQKQQNKSKQSKQPTNLPQIKVSQQTIHSLVQGYCKQAGVRNLVRKTNKIFQKIALQYVKGIDFPRLLLPEHLRPYLGLPTFYQARIFQGPPPPGIMIGLAYNNYGGSIMYIECIDQASLKKQTQIQKQQKQTKQGDKGGIGSLVVTGNIHDVMKQSVQLAYTYSKYICSTFFNNNYLQEHDIHLNFPQIQIGKDGPSAGVAITSALVSLALNVPMKRQVAMTGQITLSGKVNPIGGVKQKTMGAKRQGIKQLIFPQQNRKDVQQLQAEIKQGMNFYFASEYSQVMRTLFELQISN